MTLLEHRWFAVVLACFAVVYAASLTFVYVEGDDASSIAYHIYGRNHDVQPPYSPYHSTMDVVLSVLPANESLLRVTAISIASLAAVGLVSFILALTFQWLKDVALPAKWLIAFVVLLASPEFFYLGLAYLPSVIAMALVLLAHLVLRANPQQRTNQLLSAVIFGIGAGCRWDIVTYGAVIATDLLLGFVPPTEGLKASVQRNWRRCLVWGFLALLCFFAVITLTGYEPLTLLSERENINTYLSANSRSWLQVIASLQPLVTPGFALFFVVGLVALIRRHSPLLGIVLVGLAVVFPLVDRGVPKILLPALPGVVACCVLGFALLWQRFSQPFARLAVVVTLVAPWLIGVRTTSEGVGWGPGFELRPYDFAEIEGARFPIALGVGALFPSSEGPRALFGHAPVLLGGQWRAFVLQQDAEVQSVADYLIETPVPLLLTGGDSKFTIALWLRGYITDDPRIVSEDFALEREFSNTNGGRVLVVTREISTTELERLSTLPDLGEVVVNGYPRTIRRMYEVAPEAMERLGLLSAVLDLPALLQALPQTPE